MRKVICGTKSAE